MAELRRLIESNARDVGLMVTLRTFVEGEAVYHLVESGRLIEGKASDVGLCGYIKVS